MRSLHIKNLLRMMFLILFIVAMLMITMTNGENIDSENQEEENALVMVTPSHASIYESIVLEFQQNYHCKIKVLEKTEEEIYNELRANGGRLEGDIIFGISENLTEKCRQSLAAYKPFAQTEMVIVYSINVIEQKEVPKELAELDDIKWRGAIGCVHEKTSFMYEEVRKYAEANAMSTEQWRAYENNILPYADSEDEVADGIIEGKYLIGIVSKEKALMMMKEDNNIKYCKLGKYACPIRFDVGISRNCKQQELAAQFLEFCASNSFMQYLSEYLYFEKVAKE